MHFHQSGRGEKCRYVSVLYFRQSWDFFLVAFKTFVGFYWLFRLRSARSFSPSTEVTSIQSVCVIFFHNQYPSVVFTTVTATKRKERSGLKTSLKGQLDFP
ncbi:hypothetical protein GOODEAATRI_013427 [Goodea atripinnis]|uniref:Uncharacterized protein n=1 Tax=Goodea atripinnis TaxID=208336 RepID=A0ABV0MHG6_9TELE